MASTSTSSVSQSKKEYLEDCMCTICLCILIHPVTLPCGHELCMPCFKQSVEEANLSCPLCRTRISTWARKATRNNCLVNQKRWEQIQKLFPQRVQRRLDGLDDETDEETQEKEDIDLSYRHMVQLSEPGEIRREYEEELKRLESQQAAERQIEEEASASLIRQLRSVEEQKVQETRRQQEEIINKDSQLAQELGRLMNSTDTESPVNRLLQESKHSYPNYPLLPPSTPSDVPLPFQESSQKGKQPLVKNSNKTLETFFRRLPSGGGKRSTRCSSEPMTGRGNVGEKSCAGVVSPRCQSTPVRGKENLPLVPHISSLRADVTNDACLYENLDHTGGVQNPENSDGACVIEEGRVEIADRTVERSDSVVIVDVHVPPGNGRRESASTVHSDGSESVIICEEMDEEAAEGKKKTATTDPQFRPIQSSPHTPPKTPANANPIEPSFVRITPRILFSTDRVSSTVFPIMPSPPAVSKLVFQQTSSVSRDVRRSCTGNHRQKRNGGGMNGGGVEQIQAGASSGSGKSRPRTDKYSTAKYSKAGCDVRTDHNLRNRRARSTSPPTIKVPPPRQLASHESSSSSRGSRGYRRPSLREFRLREKKLLQSTIIEEVVSDSELSSPSPRYTLCCGRVGLLKGAGDGRRLGVKAGVAGQRDGKEVEEESDSEGEGQSLLSAPAPSRVVPSGQKPHTVCSLSQGLEDARSATSVCRTAARDAAVCPRHGRHAPLPCSPACAYSKNGDILTAIHQHPSSSPPIPGGILNPDLRSDLSEDVCGKVISGKGKRLLKKSEDSSLSHRNCPKSSVKAAVHSRSEVEKSQSLDGEKTKMGSFAQHADPKSQGLDAGSREKTKTCSLPKHTDPRAECRNTKSRTRCHAPKATEEDVPSRVSRTGAAVATVSDSEDSDGSDRLVRRVRKPVRQHQAKSKNSLHAKPSEADLNLDKAEQRKPPKTSRAGQKMEPGRNQRSIKDWFSSTQAGSCSQNGTKPSASSRKPQAKKAARVSESPATESDLSSLSSSMATSPDKLTVRASQRCRRMNPKLDNFLLTVTKKLKQFKADSYSDSNTTTPASSPSKSLILTPPTTTTPTRNLKRKRRGGGPGSSPVSKRGKPSPGPCRKILQASCSDSTESQGPECLAGSSAPSSDHTPQKNSHPLSAGEGILASEEEEEECLSQEERDHRLAMQLQEQFALADKLKLKVVRFKGTNDQYTLRTKHSSSKSSN
ncbi:hypothetical protein ACOMHN_047167 [Nucella lapillus]